MHGKTTYNSKVWFVYLCDSTVGLWPCSKNPYRIFRGCMFVVFSSMLILRSRSKKTDKTADMVMLISVILILISDIVGP